MCIFSLYCMGQPARPDTDARARCVMLYVHVWFVKIENSCRSDCKVRYISPKTNGPTSLFQSLAM